MLTPVEAETAIAVAIAPVSHELVPLAACAGRILRTALHAERDAPPFDRVAMDGIAFARGAESQRRFRIAGIQAAGAPVLALAQVEMPTIPQPTGVADGDIIGYVRWGLGMVFMLLGGSTAVYSLFTAGSRTVAKFHEYSNNRAEFGDVVTIAVAGIVVCTLCILLVVAGLRVIPVTA